MASSEADQHPKQTGNQGPDRSTVKQEHTQPKDASTSVQNTEPQDPYTSGGEKHAQRRELDRNVAGGQGQQHPDKPAGIHSTGSFTGTAEKPEIPSE